MRELRAVRGATTLAGDTFENMKERVGELMEILIDKNDIQPADIVNVIFTATPDISSGYPATAARDACSWLGKVPLLGAQELDVQSATPLCIRVLLQFYSEKTDFEHLYLQGAKRLREQKP